MDARELAYELLAEEARLMCSASRVFRAVARRGSNRVELSFQRPGEWVGLTLHTRGWGSDIGLYLRLAIEQRDGGLFISGLNVNDDGVTERSLPDAALAGDSAARTVVALCDQLLRDLWREIDSANAWSSASDSTMGEEPRNVN
jgi:hypothetical protein